MIELVNDVDVKLINVSATDDMVCMAAWVSHDQDSEERLGHQGRKEKLITFLYRNRHMSPFEHGHFTFKIDVPLFVAREFMRHRTASYNEVSGRYTEMRPRFYAGTKARVQRGKPGDYYFEDGTDEQTAVYLSSKLRKLEEDWRVYQERIAAGIAKEQAREELPLSLMTQFYVTMNPRNLMQFLDLRNDKHALKEIRDVAVKMEQIFATQMPLTYAAYKQVREERDVDVDALKAENKALKQSVDYYKAEHKKALSTIEDIEAELREIYKVRDEAVAKYNALYVNVQESKPKPVAEDDFDWGDATDDIEPNVDDAALLRIAEKFVPMFGRAVEDAKPVYNIVMQNKEKLDIDDIAERVMDAIEKRRRRNGK